MIERIFFVLVIFISLLSLLKAQSRKCQYTGNCIECSDATVTELIRDINEISEEDSLPYIDSLELSNIHFENNEIQSGWLNATSVQFSSMSISNSDLSIMGAGAFSGRPFNSLTTLNLGNIQIDVIRKQTFQDTKLSTLTIYFDVFRDVTFELNPFGAVSTTLAILSLSRCVSSETLPYITVMGNMIIFATAVLHNICLENNEDDPPELTAEE